MCRGRRCAACEEYHPLPSPLISSSLLEMGLCRNGKFSRATSQARARQERTTPSPAALQITRHTAAGHPLPPRPAAPVAHVPVTTQAWRRHSEEATTAATEEELATSCASSSTTLLGSEKARQECGARQALGHRRNPRRGRQGCRVARQHIARHAQMQTAQGCPASELGGQWSKPAQQARTARSQTGPAARSGCLRRRAGRAAARSS